MARLRRLPILVSNAALALFLLVCVAWVVSLFRTDTVGWSGFDDRAAGTWRNWGVSSFAGRVIVYRMASGTVRFDEDPRHLSGAPVPGMQPHAFHHGLSYRPDRPTLPAFVYRKRPEGPEFDDSPLRLYFIGVPHWFLALLLGIAGQPAGAGWLRLYLASRQPKPGHCRRCGYDLRASPGRCPECGTAAPSATAPSVAASVDSRPLVAVGHR